MLDFQKIPKTELHCHLDGSLSLTAIRQLAAMAGLGLPQGDEDLKQLVTAPAHISSLNDYLRTFEFVLPLLQTKEALRLAAYDVARQAAEEKVIYIEIRFAPDLSTQQGLTVVEVVESVLDGLAEAERDFGLTARAIACGMRHLPQDQTLTMFKNLVGLAGRGLVGFDFAGNEVDYPTALFEETLAQAQKLGLPFTFHAGECGCAQNISDALKLGIKRFGHGTALYKDEAVMDEVIAAGATIEMCLSSNLQTKAMPSLTDWPYPQLYAKGAKMTINTDNRTVSDTTLTQEYRLLNHYFGTTVRDFLTFNEHAIRASFVTEKEKTALLLSLKEGYQPFLD